MSRVGRSPESLASVNDAAAFGTTVNEHDAVAVEVLVVAAEDLGVAAPEVDAAGGVGEGVAVALEAEDDEDGDGSASSGHMAAITSSRVV